MNTIKAFYGDFKPSEIEKKVKELVSKLNLEEKISMVTGNEFMATPAVARLGIPRIFMTDGPMGPNQGSTTAFPASVCLAATWNTSLIEEIGQAIARETLACRRDMILGPCVNIHRIPHWGRNFESFSEDPFLTARMTVAYIKGVQKEKVIACVKHFACNNQEYERLSIDTMVDERTLHEIYLPAFRAAIVEAGCGAVMGAYNKVNNYFACENKMLLVDILRKRWGFKGFVVSDWGAVHSLAPSINALCDLEMPAPPVFRKPENVMEALHFNLIEEKVLDTIAGNLIRTMLVRGLFDKKHFKRGVMNTKQHQMLALKAAQQGIVLLKNHNNILPIDKSKIRRIAVIGPNACIPRYGGGGSSRMKPLYSVPILDGVKNKAGKNIEVLYAPGSLEGLSGERVKTENLIPADLSMGEHGLVGEYFQNEHFEGEPFMRRLDKKIDFVWWPLNPPHPSMKHEHFSVRWRGKIVAQEGGHYWIGLTSDDGSRLILDGEKVIDNWGTHGMVTKSTFIELQAGVPRDIIIEYFQGIGEAGIHLDWKKTNTPDVFAEVTDCAAKADVVIACIGTNESLESEGSDRTELTIPVEQQRLLNSISEVNPNIIVALTCGDAILMDDWIDKAQAVLVSWFYGSEGGNALADIIFGNVTPSGKLPCTFPRKWEDCPAYGNYPGNDGVVKYKEGIFVGYRHFDTKSIDVAFPFGFGLSYTSFEYSELQVKTSTQNKWPKVELTFSIKNVGSKAGAEVAQIYVRDCISSQPRPIKELKAFCRTELKPSQKAKVNVTLGAEAFAFYNSSLHKWVVEPGEFEILIGASSRDIRLSTKVQLKHKITYD